MPKYKGNSNSITKIKGIPKYKAEYRRNLSRGYSAGIPRVFRGYSWQKKNRAQLAKTKKPSHHALCLCCVERRTKDENTAASTTGLGSAVHHTKGGREGRAKNRQAHGRQQGEATNVYGTRLVWNSVISALSAPSKRSGAVSDEQTCATSLRGARRPDRGRLGSCDASTVASGSRRPIRKQPCWCENLVRS